MTVDQIDALRRQAREALAQVLDGAERGPGQPSEPRRSGRPGDLVGHTSAAQGTGGHVDYSSAWWDFDAAALRVTVSSPIPGASRPSNSRVNADSDWA